MVLTVENRSNGRKTGPRAMLCVKNPTWTVPRLKPGLRGDKPAADEIYSECFWLDCELPFSYCGVPCADTSASCHVLATVNIIAVFYVSKVTCSNCRSWPYTHTV